MWTQDSEKQFLISHLKPEFHMLEWGSGYSTLELPKYVHSCISIEHNAEWFSRLTNQGLPHNVLLKWLPNNKPWESVDGTYEEFRDYINVPFLFRPPNGFDIIYIDGRARVECAKIAKEMAHKDTLIFIHDYGKNFRQDDGNYRAYYDIIEERILKLQEIHHTMALFKI